MSAVLFGARQATRRLAGTAATAALGTSLLLAGCGTGGSGTIGRESREISGVRAVEITGNGHVSIEQTGVESLTIETDENLLGNVSAEVVDGTLVLEVEGIINPTDGITYELTVASLEGITVTGSGIVEATGLDGDRLVVMISGSGLVTVAGTAAAQEVDIGGSGQYRGRDLESATASVDIGGSGTATVSVRDRLDVNIDGAGVVTYYGDPEVDQHVSGAGHVERG